MRDSTQFFLCTAVDVLPWKSWCTHGSVWLISFTKTWYLPATCDQFGKQNKPCTSNVHIEIQEYLGSSSKSIPVQPWHIANIDYRYAYRNKIHPIQSEWRQLKSLIFSHSWHLPLYYIRTWFEDDWPFLIDSAVHQEVYHFLVQRMHPKISLSQRMHLTTSENKCKPGDQKRVIFTVWIMPRVILKSSNRRWEIKMGAESWKNFTKPRRLTLGKLT